MLEIAFASRDRFHFQGRRQFLISNPYLLATKNMTKSIVIPIYHTVEIQSNSKSADMDEKSAADQPKTPDGKAVYFAR